MKIRHTLIKQPIDKIFTDSIISTMRFIKDNIEKEKPYKVRVYPCKLPRKLKKLMKRLGSWEFEIIYTPNVTVSLVDKAEAKLDDTISSVGFLI